MSFSVQYFHATKLELQNGFLSEEESHHCLKVLRKTIGSQIDLLDGEGGVYQAEIVGKQGKLAHIKVLNQVFYENDLPDLHLVVAPTKHIDRYEFFIEKACELGVKMITPVICKNSERKHLNVEKMRKRAISACKQSGTRYFPTFNDLVKFEDLKSMQAEHRLVAHCYSQTTPHLATLDLTGNTTVLVGPEGDFTQDEVSELKEAGFQDISLGEKRLRTETAAVYIAACFNLKNIQ